MSIHVSLAETWLKRLSDFYGIASSRLEEWLKLLGFFKPIKPSLAPCPTCPPSSFEGTKTKKDLAVEV